jgi:hypothetical protein
VPGSQGAWSATGVTVALRRELGEGTEDAMASVYFFFTPSGTAHRPPR